MLPAISIQFKFEKSDSAPLRINVCRSVEGEMYLTTEFAHRKHFHSYIWWYSFKKTLYELIRIAINMFYTTYLLSTYGKSK